MRSEEISINIIVSCAANSKDLKVKKKKISHNERCGLIEGEPLFSAASYNYSPFFALFEDIDYQESRLAPDLPAQDKAGKFIGCNGFPTSYLYRQRDLYSH